MPCEFAPLDPLRWGIEEFILASLARYLIRLIGSFRIAVVLLLACQDTADMVRYEEVWQVLTYRFLDGRAFIFATIAMPGSTSRGSQVQ